MSGKDDAEWIAFHREAALRANAKVRRWFGLGEGAALSPPGSLVGPAVAARIGPPTAVDYSYAYSYTAASDSTGASGKLKVLREVAMENLLDPAAKWNDPGTSWERSGANAELLIIDDAACPALLRVKGGPETWRFKAEVLPEADDRPSDFLPTIETRRPEGLVDLYMRAGVPPESIRRIALHIYGERQRHVGCVILGAVQPPGSS